MFVVTLRASPVALLAAIVLVASAGCGAKMATTSEAGAELEDSAPPDAIGLVDTSTPADSVSPPSCTGHDEDIDGVPDECDDCPNVPNPTDDAGVGHVGAACNTPLLAQARRLTWDPFVSFAPGNTWSYYGPAQGAFAFDPSDGDSIVGGDTADNDGRFLAGPTGASPASSSVAVTAVLSIEREALSLPIAAVLARIDGASGKAFFACGVGAKAGYLYLVRSMTGFGCDGGPCPVNAFTYDAGAAGTSQLQIPSDVSHALGAKMGLRITVTSSSPTDGGAVGEVECRVFDPQAPTGLLSADPKYAMRVGITNASRWISSGEVGVLALGAKVRVHSIDVLAGD